MILRKQLLILSVCISIFWASHQNMDGYEATELEKPSKINIEKSKEVNSFTQSNAFFKNLFGKTMRILSFNCEKSASANYQSQKLSSPDGKRSVFFEASMQRPANAKRMGNSCSSSGRHTVIKSMLVENAGKTLKLNTANLGYIDLYKSYLVINPISFSPDSRFLISRIDQLASITDQFVSFAIFDFHNNYRYLKLSPCKDDQFGGMYQTFKSNTEVVFKCIETQSPYLEIVNLQTLSIRRVSISSLKLPSNPVSFGSISKEFAVKP